MKFLVYLVGDPNNRNRVSSQPNSTNLVGIGLSGRFYYLKKSYLSTIHVIIYIKHSQVTIYH